VRGRTERIVKVTLPSPSLFANFYDPQRSCGAYPTLKSFLADVTEILRQKVDELVRLRCKYVNRAFGTFPVCTVSPPLDIQRNDVHRRGRMIEKDLPSGAGATSGVPRFRRHLRVCEWCRDIEYCFAVPGHTCKYDPRMVTLIRS
jgi:methionine synthase II (cobalamin-independent)